ncbi:MAG: putative CoA-binding protein [Paracoccaceae bacterium]|jgi:predicted CoA-binding protein
MVPAMITDPEQPTDQDLRRVLNASKSVAVVGVSPNETRPSFFVARYLKLKGYRIIPINPGHAGETLLGATVRASLADIPPEDGEVHMVDIFRRSEAVGPIVDEAMAHLAPRGLKSVWMQIGVVNKDAAAVAGAAGLDVVMNRCPKIEYQRLFGELRWGGFNTGMISSKLR